MVVANGLQKKEESQKDRSIDPMETPGKKET